MADEFLTTAPRRVLFLVGAHLAMPVITTVFVGAVTLLTLRLAFDGLDPAGTARRVAAAVLAWELVTAVAWAARHWYGPAGIATLVRTGRAEQRTRPGRRSRVLRWTRDFVALVTVVFGVLLVRFPDDPSAPWAAGVILLVVKGLQLGMYGTGYAVDKALTRLGTASRRRRDA